MSCVWRWYLHTLYTHILKFNENLKRVFFFKRGQTVTYMESVHLCGKNKFFILAIVAHTSLGGLFLYLVRVCEWI